MSSTQGDTRQVELSVQGMSCGHCVQHVREGIAGTPGVSRVEVDLEGGRATVEYDPGAVAPTALVEAVTKAGYQAQVAGAEGGEGEGPRDLGSLPRRDA